MIDINLIRTNPDKIKDSQRKRGDSTIVIDEILSIDNSWRQHLKELESLKHKKNQASLEINKLKKQGSSITSKIKELQVLSDKIKENEEKVLELRLQIDTKLSTVPNLVDKTVPVGPNDKYNKVVNVKGKIPKFSFKPKSHEELGKNLDIIDMERAAKLAGSGFYILKGKGAQLQRAIVQFMIDFHIKNGFTEINPPQLVNEKTVFGTGNLPKFEKDLYKTREGFYLIPTAEVPVTNIHANETLEEKDLPKYYVSFTQCYRVEAGKHGSETPGIYRLHQFEKVEMVKIVYPDTSWKELESMRASAEKILDKLKLPYRTIVLSTGDMGFASAKTYDIEVYSPSMKRYLEASSCSNCTDFQARRMNTKYKAQEGNKFVHTLNGSGLALPRLFISLLENYQQKDGSIKIPTVLHNYLPFKKIEKVKNS
jgi:seryl-tRNA synthetase